MRVATQSWVVREYRRGLSTRPRVEDQLGGSVVAYLHHLGPARPLGSPGLSCTGRVSDPKFSDELGGHYGVEG